MSLNWIDCIDKTLWICKLSLVRISVILDMFASGLSGGFIHITSPSLLMGRELLKYKESAILIKNKCLHR